MTNGCLAIRPFNVKKTKNDHNRPPVQLSIARQCSVECIEKCGMRIYRPVGWGTRGNSSRVSVVDTERKGGKNIIELSSINIHRFVFKRYCQSPPLLRREVFVHTTSYRVYLSFENQTLKNPSLYLFRPLITPISLPHHQ